MLLQLAAPSACSAGQLACRVAGCAGVQLHSALHLLCCVHPGSTHLLTPTPTLALLCVQVQRHQLQRRVCKCQAGVSTNGAAAAKPAYPPSAGYGISEEELDMPPGTPLQKGTLVARLLAAKEASGKTFSQIAEEVGLTNVYCAQLFYNQVG